MIAAARLLLLLSKACIVSGLCMPDPPVPRSPILLLLTFRVKVWSDIVSAEDHTGVHPTFIVVDVDLRPGGFNCCLRLGQSIKTVLQLLPIVSELYLECRCGALKAVFDNSNVVGVLDRWTHMISRQCSLSRQKARCCG